MVMQKQHDACCRHVDGPDKPDRGIHVMSVPRKDLATVILSADKVDNHDKQASSRYMVSVQPLRQAR